MREGRIEAPCNALCRLKTAWYVAWWGAVVDEGDDHGDQGYQQHAPPPALGSHVGEGLVRVVGHTHWLRGLSGCVKALEGRSRRVAGRGEGAALRGLSEVAEQRRSTWNSRTRHKRGCSNQEGSSGCVEAKVYSEEKGNECAEKESSVSRPGVVSARIHVPAQAGVALSLRSGPIRQGVGYGARRPSLPGLRWRRSRCRCARKGLQVLV